MPHIDLEKLIRILGQIAEILRSKPEVALTELRKISDMIDNQIPYRDGHSRRVAEYAILTGKRLGLSDEEIVTLEAAALLHDFGKIGVEDNILDKPASLVDAEKAEVEKHVLRGYYMLAGFVELGDALKGIKSHHEHYNGLGYPQGLTDGYIPLMGRIIAVADAYDAMISDRPYRKAKKHEEAVDELEKFAGQQFDPNIVKVFLSIIE